jgi:hypothetical protein
MLDRDDITEFLDEELEDLETEIPKDTSKGDLVEAFCQYVELDYYDWLKSNFNTFFESDWDDTRKKIRKYVH